MLLEALLLPEVCVDGWFCVWLTQAVQSMVQLAMQYIDQTPDIDTKIELIKTLNSVSAGKVIHVQKSVYIYLYFEDFDVLSIAQFADRFMLR